MITALTKQANINREIFVVVPSGPPKDIKFKYDNPALLDMSWSPPDVEEQNGLITNYSVCFQNGTAAENCSSNETTTISTNTTSTKLENLHKAEIYYIWIRAHTKIGPGPYSEKNQIITGTGE